VGGGGCLKRYELKAGSVPRKGITVKRSRCGSHSPSLPGYSIAQDTIVVKLQKAVMAEGGILLVCI
jgi:hypothetical protein